MKTIMKYLNAEMNPISFVVSCGVIYLGIKLLELLVFPCV